MRIVTDRNFGRRECPSCGCEVPANNNRCPVCGYEFPTASPLQTRLRVWGAILMLLLLLILVLGLLQ